MVYSRFCSVSFTLRHPLKTMFPRVPRLSVAVYAVRKQTASPKARSLRLFYDMDQSISYSALQRTAFGALFYDQGWSPNS